MLASRRFGITRASGGYENQAPEEVSVTYRQLALALIAGSVLSACSGGANEYRYEEEVSASADTADLTITEIPANLFEDGRDRLNDLPVIVYTETLPGSGLEVSYTTGQQRDWIDPLFVEAQWLHMLECTGVTLPTPMILIVEDEVAPLYLEDDVIRHIDGRTVASSSLDEQGPVLQVSQSDFDGSIGTPGFNTRAIAGRYLWLTANLAERDYPFVCSRG